MARSRLFSGGEVEHFPAIDQRGHDQHGARARARAPRDAWRRSRAAACCPRSTPPADFRACDGPDAGDRRARRRPADPCGGRSRVCSALSNLPAPALASRAAISGRSAAIASGAASLDSSSAIRASRASTRFRSSPTSSAPCPGEAAADEVPDWRMLHVELLGPPACALATWAFAAANRRAICSVSAWSAASPASWLCQRSR